MDVEISAEYKLPVGTLVAPMPSSAKKPCNLFHKKQKKRKRFFIFWLQERFSLPILFHFYVSNSPSRVWVEEWLLMDRKSLLMGTKHWVETVMQINRKVRQMNLMLNFLYINHSVYCIWRVKCDFSPQRNHRNWNVNNSSWLLIWHSWQGISFNFLRGWRALNSFVNIFLLREEERNAFDFEPRIIPYICHFFYTGKIFGE